VCDTLPDADIQLYTWGFDGSRSWDFHFISNVTVQTYYCLVPVASVFTDKTIYENYDLELSCTSPITNLNPMSIRMTSYDYSGFAVDSILVNYVDIDVGHPYYDTGQWFLSTAIRTVRVDFIFTVAQGAITCDLFLEFSPSPYSSSIDQNGNYTNFLQVAGLDANPRNNVPGAIASVVTAVAGINPVVVSGNVNIPGTVNFNATNSPGYIRTVSPNGAPQDYFYPVNLAGSPSQLIQRSKEWECAHLPYFKRILCETKIIQN